MKRWKRVVVTMTALAMFLTACGGGGGEDPVPDTTVPVVDNTHTPGVLRMNAADPSTLDPAHCGDTGCAVFVSEIFSGLYTVMLRSQVEASPGVVAQCPSGSDAEDICLVADIAAGFPEKVVHDDGTVTFTFTLREDVYFHNGRQATAEDVKWSWERAANPATVSSTFELYLTDIVGAWDRFRRRSDEISGVQVIDDFTLEVTIDGDKPYWLWNLAYPTTFVVDRNQADPITGVANWTKNPNGTGPFKLDKYDEGHQLILVRNDDYYLRSVLLDKAIFNLAGGDTLTKYEAEELDVAGIGLADIENVRDPNNPLNADLVTGKNEIGTIYLGFNLNDPVLDDVKLRQALSYAIDKETIIEVVLKDAVAPAYSFTPPGMPDYEPPTGVVPRNDSDEARQANLEKARQLLAESDYNGEEIVLTVSGQSANTADWIEAIVQGWRTELGVDVRIEPAGDFQVYQQNLKQGNLQMYVIGWIADYPDPYDFLDLKLHGDRSSTNNEVRYDNPEFNALLEQARTEQDPEVRMALYQQAEELMLADAPIIVIYHPKNQFLKKSYVEGFVSTPMVMPRLAFVEVK